MDAVVSNPPYSQAWNPADKEADARYARFGLAPKGKADYAFLLHDLFHLKTDGIMTIVLPHGVLFRGGEEGTIRRNLIENNHIDAIIGLPANIFFGTGIPTIIMVLKQKRENTDVLIIDASKGFAKVGKNNVLRACDIKKIVDAVISRCSHEKFSRAVSRDEIRENDYNLNIPRYVDSSEKAESWDIYASLFGGIPESELAELQEYWAAFPNLKADLFSAVNSGYYQAKVADFKQAVFSHPDIVKYTAAYRAAFADFESFLSAELLGGMGSVNPSRQETILSEDIFARLGSIPLVDKYRAYQLLDEEWKKIAVDLEMIQTEGFAAVKQVDPYMVTKKKDGKDQEVQDGWVGHVIPFALAQQALLPDALSALRNKEARLGEIAAEYEALLDELGEEDKEKDFLNDKVLDLNNEEKTLKKQVKDDSKALHLLTKASIERLTDEQALELIKLKWIAPLVSSMEGLPAAVIDDFIAKLIALSKKYETTLTAVDKQIAETEATLVSLLDELRGNEYDMLGIKELKKLLKGEE